MRHIYYPSQDATVYSAQPNFNTGLDELLEVGKTDHGTGIARSYIQFDTTEIVQSALDNNIPDSAQYFLKMYVADASDLRNNQPIQVHQLSSSWVEGTGRFLQSVIQDTDGVTWNSLPSVTSASVDLYFTSQFFPSQYFSETRAVTDNTAKLNQVRTDIEINVTPFVNTWRSTNVNNGVAVVFDSGSEADVKNMGKIRFFSKDTNTIYKPHLIVKYVDQQYTTASMMSYPLSDLLVIPSTLKASYTVGEMARVELAVRARVPLKTFAEQFTQYLGQRYLPSSSYFSVTDVLTNNVVIPYGDDSLISCDGAVSYFNFAIENMYPQRYYRISLKIQSGMNLQIFSDPTFIFKVTL